MEATPALSKGAKQVGQVNVLEASARSMDPVTADVDLAKLARDEAFMNEIVVVYLHKTTDKNAANHVLLNVNGTNQPVFRGQKTPMKRKYLEVLARMKEASYEQVTHPIELDRYEMNETIANAYPFVVSEDSNPAGAAWLDHIMQEAN